MRRVPAVVAAGLALLLATACGDNGDDTPDDPGTTAAPPATTAAAEPGGAASTAEVCAQIEARFTELEGEGQQIRGALVEAAESGDEAALEQARSDYLEFVGGFAEDIRAIAADAEDPGLRAAIEQSADEFETVGEQAAANPQEIQNIDTSRLQTALEDAQTYCE